MLPPRGLGTRTPTELPCIHVACSYREDKLSPYVYKDSACFFLTCGGDGLTGHFCIQNPQIFSASPPSSHFFSQSVPPSPCPLILPSISTSLSLSLIQPHPSPPSNPQLVRPSIRHSAVPRRAGRSRADCTRGLGGVTTPCCLLGSCLLDDMTVHLKGKLVVCVCAAICLFSGR